MMRLLIILSCWFLMTTSAFAQASRDFDGTGDSLNMGNNLDVTTGDFSVCIYVDTDEDALSDHFIGKKNNWNAAVAGYGIRQGGADAAVVGVDDGVDTCGQGGTTDIDALGFVWVCGTFDATVELSEILVNSVSEGVNDCINIDSQTNAVAFTVGTSPDLTSDLDGRACYGHMYTRVLTAVEVTELRWFPGRIADSMGGFWPIWGSNSPEVDLSGNGLTGTLSTDNPAANVNGPPVMFGEGMLL